MSDNIKVVVKVRPLISRELEDKQQYQWRVDQNTLNQIDSGGRDFGQAFTFDKVYSEVTATSDVYNDIAKPIVEAAVAGFNGTIFAYGQTSSGKTYTMTGTDKCPGIIPLAVLDLFQTIKNIPKRDFVVSVSYIEIYNETLKDLLDLKKVVKIHETLSSVKVDATDKVTASPEEVLEAMKMGNVNRHTGYTKMNESSSRSHSIFQINIESREHHIEGEEQHIEGEEQAGCVNVSQLNLVDLAGSERAGQTGATGLRFKEGTLINKSLTSLALVIKQLSEDPNKFVNYRDSKLTRILQNSLGGNAKTSIICAVTPAALEETISTLQFATRAKAIKNKPEVNAVATNSTKHIQRLTKQLSELQSQLESKKNLEVMLESKKNKEQDLQKQIANLQRFIINGFGQRSNVEQLGGVRRKLLPSRRITISTTSLRPIEEDVPKVPSRRFCTPSLKYNPSLVQNPADSEFVPIQNPSKLTSLPEEPPRLVTPPPNERKVKFGDEVIELDSDDDDDSSVQICSPHHECFGATKTPPCVLRKTAQQAERQLKDLVELTDREKMFTPDVVELLEKLELSNLKTVKLQDEIEVLISTTKKKDLEMELLRKKISNTELEIKNFTAVVSEFEQQREVYNTQLTEWEVRYETQKNKAKLREQELLSLLEEQKIKRAQDIGKIPYKAKDREIIHFMDMSKDISLVNSDNESSFVQNDEDESSNRTNVLLADMQAQLTAKNDLILELQCSIEQQRKQIDLLENSSQDLLDLVSSFKEKMCEIEKENELLKSTVKELNSTIKIQNENMELAQNDMKSYNSVISELQIQLNRKDNLVNIKLSDELMESLLANEDKTIANNENLKNIIHSFKLTIENSKKEIDVLKSNTSSDNQETITRLKNEITKLTKQANENVITINTLLQEKAKFAHIEQELIEKLSEVEERKSENGILIKEQFSLIEKLKNDVITLETSLASNANKLSETLIKETHEVSSKLAISEEENQAKDVIIASLNTQINEYHNCVNTAKLGIRKLQNVFSALTGEARDIPLQLDSFVVVYNALNEKLNALEVKAVETVFQKELALKNNVELQKEIDNLVIQHDIELKKLSETIENLNEKVHKLSNEIKLASEENSGKSIEIEKLIQETDKLKSQLDKNKKTDDVISEKDLAITALKENETVILETTEKLKTEAENYVKIIKGKECIIDELNNKNEVVTLEIIQLKDQLMQKECELNQYQQKLHDDNKSTDLLVQSIILKLSSIIDRINEENSSSQCKTTYENENIQEYVIYLLELVSNHIFMESTICKRNNELQSELKNISIYNDSLKNDLINTSEVLQNLQKELTLKSAEINTIEQKAREYKVQLGSFDKEMKNQMMFLQSENEKLKTRCIELNQETKNQLDFLSDENVISPKKIYNEPRVEDKSNTEILSPPSLLTICCDRISQAIDSKQNLASKTTSGFAENAESSYLHSSDYDDQDLYSTQQENIRLMKIIEELEIVNKELNAERIETRSEVRLLLAETEELQKKLCNHKTILSILTATTYTENKSLKSQLKGFQHHHSRFHNVCQRDIPEFKNQLNILMSILKDDSLPSLSDMNSTNGQKKNESTFDGDLLMLDTNVTLATADNTLTSYNQTCLDYTQLNETYNHNQTEINLLTNHLEMELEVLKKENETLKNQLVEYFNKESQCRPVKNSELPSVGNLQEELDNHLEKELKVLKKDNETLNNQFIEYFDKESQCSPVKIGEYINFGNHEEELDGKIAFLTEKLADASKQKEIMEKRYNDLVLEIPSIDALVLKMKAVEETLKTKEKELVKITDALNAKSKQYTSLQEENDTLSTQVMEHISEVDDLNKEVEKLKQKNLELIAQSQALYLKNRTKLQDVRVDTVLTDMSIKNQLENINMSMDLDESMNFEMAYDSLPSSPQNKKCNMPDIQEERPLDLYDIDKSECYNFYLDKTGTENENVLKNIRIIEIMKQLHTILITRHSNEVENLVNKLKDYEETQARLHIQIKDLNEDYLKLKNELGEKDSSLNIISNVVTQLKENLTMAKDINLTTIDLEANAKITKVLKEEFLLIVDKNFNLSSVFVFEKITDHTNKLVQEIDSINELLLQSKCQLTEKQKECTLLRAQNEKIQEINKGITLDIIRKEEDTQNIIKKTYQELMERNMINSDNFSFCEPVTVQVLVRLLEYFINEYQKEKAKVESSHKIEDTKLALEDKEMQLKELLSKVEVLESHNSKNIEQLTQYDETIQTLKASQHELNSSLNKQLDVNARNKELIEKFSEERKQLKQTISNKEEIIHSISNKEVEIKELLRKIQCLQDENEKLQSINVNILKESESYASELEKSCQIIKQNNIDLDKMTSEILILRESVKEATAHVDTMKQEVQNLKDKYTEVKRELEIKCRECSRLEINIKTHEKTAEIQSRMINRLQKLKEEDDNANGGRIENLNELIEKNKQLQRECEELKNSVKNSREEIENLKNIKESLEALTDSEDSGRRSRVSIDAIADCSKRRRQSLHDSKRLFDKLGEHKNLGALFGSSQKPEDLFMDIDDESLSGRSTPFGMGKGRDSLLSRTDHSDKDDEHSRPNSALAKATRRRRQSSHDLHRSVTPQADLSHYVIDELKEDTSRVRINSDNEVIQLKTQLTSCEKELEELKEKYRELDEECEICSEYLRERDAQCSRLKKEKAALEKQVLEMKSKVGSASSSFSFNVKPNVAHACVNTDEDWTNLHDVVVDRMSYDAEVEKNKKLSKTIEELRFKKLDLKKTLDKMQKALEKNSAKDNSRELEHTRQELRSCKEKLEDMRTKYKELDDECETCASYLKEREEQCRQLKEARAALETRLNTAETKLRELQDKSTLEHSKSVRKKRQTFHDMNRPETSAMDQMDASAETTHDFSSSQRASDSVRGTGDDKSTIDAQYFKKKIERLTMEKAQLEDQLRLAYVANPICVATGSAIVQNQQLTDVMKENQKLKKINARLVTICKKRGKSANRENEDPCEQG